MQEQTGVQQAIGMERYEKMMAIALEEARYGRVEGGIPIGAAMFTRDGKRLVFASNRNGKQPHETNIFVADWK